MSGDDDAQRQGLDADLLVRVLPLGVEEPHDVRVVRVQVHRTGAWRAPSWFAYEKESSSSFITGMTPDDWFSMCLIGAPCSRMFDRSRATPPPALGQLQGGVDAARDGLHVVLDAQQEAGHGLAALRLAEVEERRGGRRLEPAGHDLVDELQREGLVALGQRERHHRHAVLETLQVPLPVERLQRVRGVVLEGAEEGLEPELLRVGVLEQPLDELAVVLREDLGLVVLLLDQVVELLLEVVEEDGVLVDVLQEVLPRRLPVLVELDLTVAPVQVQHRVQRVVVHLGRDGDDLRAVRQAGIRDCRCQKNRPHPSRTRVTSSVVPMSSKAYRYGTWHFAAMMSPAMQ